MTARKGNMHRGPSWTRAEAIRDLARPSGPPVHAVGFFLRRPSILTETVICFGPLDRVGVGADAKKGNHWPRRMGYHRSIGICADRARAACTATPTTHSHGRYQEAFGRRW